MGIKTLWQRCKRTLMIVYWKCISVGHCSFAQCCQPTAKLTRCGRPTLSPAAQRHKPTSGFTTPLRPNSHKGNQALISVTVPRSNVSLLKALTLKLYSKQETLERESWRKIFCCHQEWARLGEKKPLDKEMGGFGGHANIDFQDGRTRWEEALAWYKNQTPLKNEQDCSLGSQQAAGVHTFLCY